MRIMRAIDCKACRSEIEDAAPGERLRGLALVHLETCARCRGFSEQRQALRELVSSLGTVAAPHDFEWRLRARINAEKVTEHRPRLRLGYAPGAQAIALAASFMLVIGIAVLLKQTGTERSPARLPVEVVRGTETSAGRTTEGSSVSLSEAASASPQDRVTKMHATNPLASNRARVARAPRVKSARMRTEMVAEAASNRSLRSNDFSSRAAPVVNLFSVPVRPPSQAVKVILDEGRGTRRTVSLQPITFGSQAILERRMDASGDDIW